MKRAAKTFERGEVVRSGIRYVIRWDLPPKSYFRQMTGIGPAFGASLAETQRFDSEREAQQVIDRFPIVAAVGSEVETVRDIVPTRRIRKRKP